MRLIQRAPIWYLFCPVNLTMQPSIPLCLLRIWCRKKDAWLSFKTKSSDRYLVNPQGYFIELPEGSLTAISPRVTFPLHNRFPSVVLDDLAIRQQFGPDAYFISVPLSAQRRQDPVVVSVEELAADPFAGVAFPDGLDEIERYTLLRAIENGLVPVSELGRIAPLLQKGETVGELLIHRDVCHWEPLLAYCLDIRPPSRLDPPSLRTLIERREWELTGEILFALGKINRTQLEHTLKSKREGNQALGQILTAMGACSQDDINHCLKIQEHIKDVGGEVALIGKLLVSQGIVSDDDLEEVLRKQRVARQPLGRILISMGACTQRDIEDYENVHGGRGFQQEIDELALGNFLLKIDTITKIQLEEALRIQMRGRQVLGEMLVSLGMCTAQDIENVIALQQEVRESYRSGVEKLGDLLIKKGKVPPAKIDEAIQLQSIGRQPFGAILVALGACSAADIMQALEIQHKWRERPREQGDRLGEVLVRYGILTEESLEAPLLKHLREEKPLGRILIEDRVCKPEQIIDVLISRDQTRQREFLDYVRSHLPRRERLPQEEVLAADRQAAPGNQASIVDKISSWFNRQRQKS